jgi:hypothetical protein
MPDTYPTVSAERGSRIQNTVAMATEFTVVSFWQPKSGSADGSYEHETFTDQRDAYDVFTDYERGEYPRARAVCIFASRHGVPIGRIA